MVEASSHRSDPTVPNRFHRDSAEMHPVDVLMKPASHVTIGEVMQVLQEMKTDHETDCLGTAAAPAVVPGRVSSSE